MGTQTGISWTDKTFNVVWGCSRYDEMCIYCYAERLDSRYSKDGHWGVKNPRREMSDKYWKQLFAWNEDAKRKGIQYKVFCSSMADWAEDHPQVAKAREKLFPIIKQTPHLTYQLLSKRYDKIKEFLPSDWGNGYDNVWLGISVGLQKRADQYIPVFLDVAAKTRFLSCEPLIGELNLEKYLPKLDWIIAGGESGHGSYPEDKSVKFRYRECKLEWIEKIVSQCKENNTSVFVKQLGTHLSKTMGLKNRSGADINEFPKHLQFQEFPK